MSSQKFFAVSLFNVPTKDVYFLFIINGERNGIGREYNEDDSEGFCEGDDELSECFFGKYIYEYYISINGR